jgi:hypothetical protein
MVSEGLPALGRSEKDSAEKLLANMVTVEECVRNCRSIGHAGRRIAIRPVQGVVGRLKRLLSRARAVPRQTRSALQKSEFRKPPPVGNAPAVPSEDVCAKGRWGHRRPMPSGQRIATLGSMLLVARPTANGRYRRVSPVSPRPREGPLTEPTAGAQPWRRERVLMPHCRPSPRASPCRPMP